MSANVAIAARRLVVAVQATGARVTGVVSAEIAIVAIGGRPARADSSFTNIRNSTGDFVVTGD